MKTKLVIILSTLLALQGCATVTEGTKQNITFKNLPESGCQVQEAFVTPNWNTIPVQKSKDDLVIACKDFEKVIPSKVSKNGLVGAALLDFGIVDSITGAMWLYPSEVNLEASGE